jgi:hypothetical protein
MDGLGRGNRVIDEAAEESGRDPWSIRRLLNIGILEGQSSHRVEQRLPMTLEHGVSTFVSMGDDPSRCSDSPRRLRRAAQLGRFGQGDSATVEPMEITRLQPDGLVVSPTFSHVASCPPVRRPSTSAVRTA